jgi:outer membrane protein OmpA-like peptidoglycan-associated protein
MHTPIRWISLAATSLVLAACSSTPPANPDLAAARTVVDRAQQDPHVARRAAIELEKAQQAMTRAENSWAKDRDKDETRHLAYIAQQRAETALAIGNQGRAEERLQNSSTEREKARLEARTREAEQATQQAQTARSEAAQATQQAQTARTEAELARERAAQQSQRANSLEQDLKSLQARQTQRGLVVTIGDVLFATGQATLFEGGLRNAEQLATVLKQHPDRRVLIEGFTDNTGNAKLNENLSLRRADAFRSALIERGVSSDRIEVRGLGPAYPVADNRIPGGRQQNRRVEILFSNPQGQFAQRG